MKKKNMPEHKKSRGMSLPGALATGIGMGITVWVILVFAAAYFISGSVTPEVFIMPVVYVLAAVSAVVSSVFSVKLSGMNSVVPGIVSGALLLVCVFVLSLFGADREAVTSPLLRALLCADFAVFSLIGARLAVTGGRKRTRSHR